jgi:molybdopterin molybdotransferase
MAGARRVSGAGMRTVDEAVRALLEQTRRPRETIRLPLDAALGRALAEDVVAGIDVPPADNSAMDGYAFRHADAAGDAEAGLPLSQRIPAGVVPEPLAAGSAARIFTGAEVPPGADTVVMQEDCEAGDGRVRIRQRPVQGANIRRRGQDVHRGQRVLSAGRRLRPQDLGLAASLGVATLTTWRRLRVAVLSTGDELVEPGQPAGPGRIYNSNRYLVAAQLATWGFEAVDLGIVRDRPDSVRESLLRAAQEADVIVTTGGVSVGEEDHVKNVVRELGSLDLWRIAIKPGKPFAFGFVGDTPFLGLPGNPVSVFVTLLVVARPFLFACQGLSDYLLKPLARTAGFSRRGGTREDYLRVRAAQAGLEPFPNQSSGVLSSVSWADGLVRQRVGQDIAEGDSVDYLPWSLFD